MIDKKAQKAVYNALNKRLGGYSAFIVDIYKQLNNFACSLLSSIDYDGSKPFSFSDYPQLNYKVAQLERQFVAQMQTAINSGIMTEWSNGNKQCDTLATKCLKMYGTAITNNYRKKYFRANTEALNAFMKRRDNGLNLSGRLWKQSAMYKEGLETAISVAVAKGTSAIALSKRVSQFLNNFDKLKADYSQTFGKAKDIKDCEFASIRLARSEINMAYRTAEQTRWKQMDFVLGYEIQLSKQHSEHDICDELAGRYPKDFVWTGWHPNDMCFSVPILADVKDFVKMQKGEPHSAFQVTDVPDSFKNYVATNADMIGQAFNGERSLPYFLRDNKGLVKGFME